MADRDERRGREDRGRGGAPGRAPARPMRGERRDVRGDRPPPDARAPEVGDEPAMRWLREHDPEWHGPDRPSYEGPDRDGDWVRPGSEVQLRGDARAQGYALPRYEIPMAMGAGDQGWRGGANDESWLAGDDEFHAYDGQGLLGGREGHWQGGYGFGPYGFGQGSVDRGAGEPAGPFRGPPRDERSARPGRAPRNYKRSNERIREDVCEAIVRAGDVDAGDVEVQVTDAEVTLAGTVEARWEKRRLEDLALAVPGVVDVHNHLRVRPPGERPGEPRPQAGESPTAIPAEAGGPQPPGPRSPRPST